MPAAGMDTKSLTNAWKKTNEQKLFNNLKIDHGFSQALALSLVQLMHDHIETNYGHLRGDSQVVYHAVSAQESPGKSIDHFVLYQLPSPYPIPMMQRSERPGCYRPAQAQAPQICE